MRFLLPALLCLSTACASAPTATAPVSEFVLVRHAEKGSDDPRDPHLSAAGQARAQRLASDLGKGKLVAVYSTDYRRTRETAQPSADGHRLALTIYNAQSPPTELAARLRSDHPQGSVLVVGHSNTVPQLAAALCGCEVAPMAEDEFDRRIGISFDAQGRATLSQTRY
ncbi:SixA phosphatase family protein [Lysobacter silvisoli]|uniref:Histidine phosphatase family protein n=1 Tax=Lysobacter silvisoli TaxID=2293254 RepID=A0A371K1Y4_9GAMM|nr:phosphoglycerate mutase family protein [Lysobacter silvisoli]RDZ27847.1 hypothetical protein DX914_01375 [Lysobacter silvisoli]